MISQALLDYYRCPEPFATFVLTDALASSVGYFRLGEDMICYGQCTPAVPTALTVNSLTNARSAVSTIGETLRLPFDPDAVVENLRCERYVGNTLNCKSQVEAKSLLRNAYYFLRPLLPVPVRRHLQRFYLRGWDKVPFPAWPVDMTVDRLLAQLLQFALEARGVDRVPFIWFWPEGKMGCAAMTHDVETRTGLAFCPALMDLDDSFGIKSSFQLIPEVRYPVAPAAVRGFRARGFEVNVHDLNHDGQLFKDREEFLRRAGRINHYAKEFGAPGFRSGALSRNPAWVQALHFSYDMSVPNVAHLDPQRGGCCTVMPYFLGRLLELPLTTTQDYSLFHILGDYSLELWKRQIDLILSMHGLVSFNIHPDYIIESRARATYAALLAYLAELRAERNLWIARPGEVERWWRARNQMNLVAESGGWRIEGPESHRARIAYAMRSGDRLVYTLEEEAK